jgi:hypothetical protein
MSDRIRFYLRSSARNFANWLEKHYGHLQIPRHAECWLRSYFDVTPPHAWIQLVAFYRSDPDDERRSGWTPFDPAQGIHFDVCEIGTEYDSRLEVEAECIASSLPLRPFFRDLLADIAAAWPEASAAIGAALDTLGGDASDAAPALALDRTDPPDKPWEQIPDKAWYRHAVRLAHQGYSAPQIAGQIGRVTAATVRNRLSLLRKEYGPEIVPLLPRPGRSW